MRKIELKAKLKGKKKKVRIFERQELTKFVQNLSMGKKGTIWRCWDPKRIYFMRKKLRNWNCRRKIIYCVFRNKIRDTIIKQKKMNVRRSLLDDIKTQQLKRHGHVQRMEERRLPRKVMKWSPPGRRKWGRPKATWAEGIRGLMGEKGLMGEDWNDRDIWKKKIR